MTTSDLAWEVVSQQIRKFFPEVGLLCKFFVSNFN